MILFFAFLPTNKVVLGFEKLIKIMLKKTNKLIDYFEENYIGKIKLNIRIIPKFPIYM